MGYWEKADWQSIKKDIQKGWKEGVAVVKEGSIVAKMKAGELTDEGKRRYKIFELKTKIHKKIYDLGEQVHVLLSGNKKAANPALDATVKRVMADIGKLESQIAKLEDTKAAAKPAAKRKKA
jgi:Holliday junction resolvase